MHSCIELQSKQKPTYFSSEQRARLRTEAIPQHVAIIPDGNRRWAIEQMIACQEGHRKGGDTLIEIVKGARELDIKTVTFYLFSTENWGRPAEEINALMWLLYTFLVEQQSTMLEYGIRVCTIGDLAALPTYVQRQIAETKQATSHCGDIDMVMALNYGGRDEICRAIQRIISDCEVHKMKKEQIDEKIVSRYLDTAEWDDPDLLIRTGGEMRVSNYLLWQISYSEIYSSHVLWPDFRPSHLFQAVENFQQRQRRLGKT